MPAQQIKDHLLKIIFQVNCQTTSNRSWKVLIFTVDKIPLNTVTVAADLAWQLLGLSRSQQTSIKRLWSNWAISQRIASFHYPWRVSLLKPIWFEGKNDFFTLSYSLVSQIFFNLTARGWSNIKIRRMFLAIFYLSLCLLFNNPSIFMLPLSARWRSQWLSTIPTAVVFILNAEATNISRFFRPSYSFNVCEQSNSRE